jgi:hypothetical protein
VLLVQRLVWGNRPLFSRLRRLDLSWNTSLPLDVARFLSPLLGSAKDLQLLKLDHTCAGSLGLIAKGIVRLNWAGRKGIRSGKEGGPDKIFFRNRFSDYF